MAEIVNLRRARKQRRAPKTKRRPPPIASPMASARRPSAKRAPSANAPSARSKAIAASRTAKSDDDGAAARRTAIVKRSLTIAGHRTSVSLEEAFWRRLKALAAARRRSLGAMIAEIDAAREGANLSSAIRVFVLENSLQ